jgi:phosphoribosylformylglycinamidine synthase
MASKGGVGIRLDMDACPCREEGMTPYEMMLSESQERMLMVLKPGREAEAEAIFRKWELDFAVIGDGDRHRPMELVWKGETSPTSRSGPLADEAPLYDRPALSQDEYKAWAQVTPLGEVPAVDRHRGDLLKLMAPPPSPAARWIWEQI